MRGRSFSLRLGLLVGVALGGCGRWGFEPGEGTGAATDAGRGADAPVVPADPALVDVTGPGSELVTDLAYGPGGALAVIGQFGPSAELGGGSVTTAASAGDLLLGVVEPTGTSRWVLALGVSTFGIGQNVAWEGATVIGGGYFSGTTQLGALSSGSGQDVVLVRASADGTQVTAARWGGSQNVQLRGLASDGATTAIVGLYAGSPDFGGGPLPATAQDNGFIAVGGPGTFPAARALNGGSDVYVNDVAFDADGALCVTGRFNATTDFGAGPVGSAGSSTFVAKYEADLALRWVRTFGTGLTATGVAATADGDCVAVGVYATVITIAPEMVTSAGGQDAYVVRFDSAAGDLRWLRSFGSPNSEGVFAVDILRTGEVAVSGTFAGTLAMGGLTAISEGGTDGFVAVLGDDGEPERLLPIGGTGDITSTVGGLAVEPAGGVVAVGVQYTGELRVGALTRTATGTDAAIVILPVAP